jgi:exonuclease SbcC
MITSIELGDFLSHSETKLDFDDGVTVFVGHNGAGKSSIIDAITFSLFGNHTRKSNKGLIRRGSNQGFAKIEFSVNGRHYQTVRKVDSKGGVVAKFSEMVNGETIEIAAGERRQFGESMTHEVEKTIGLDFEKLKIASIVQQGELNSIIKAKPKEFKELLNAIIGIDKLDVASEAMKTANKGFREKIREDIGYDDTHIDILQRELDKHQKELEEATPQKEDLISKQNQLQEELSRLNTRLERDAPKGEKINILRQRKQDLQSYAKEAIQQIQREITEKERKIKECRECFEHVGSKNELESKSERIEIAIQETQKKIKDLTADAASLREKEILATKLQLKNGRCPVCDSRVEKLNPLFQQEHLTQELKNIQQRIADAEKEYALYNQKRSEFSNRLQNVREAETTLRIHAINSKDDIITIQEEINIKRQSVKNIPLSTSDNLLEISVIDSHAKRIFDEILKLESETKGFNEKEFQGLKDDINEKRSMLSYLDRQIGAISEKICRNQEQIGTIQNAIKKLKVVKEYVVGLEDIQTKVFSRDGPVATSLRSWALNTISDKASEYLTLLNTKIQRMQLSEKSRDISIMCYSKNEMLDIESLSGGEQVSVALALRLGMASLLGASNLNLMILDEPTTHLDAERKKSLVGVLSQLSDIANSKTPMQFIVITHDAEIFEDSTVEKIYKFESTEHGSKVTAL